MSCPLALIAAVRESLNRWGYTSITRSTLDRLGFDGSSNDMVRAMCAENGWFAEYGTLAIAIARDRWKIGGGSKEAKKRKR